VPWGVLGLCVAWLFIKRREIRSAMDQMVTAVFAGAGVGIATLAYFIPVTADLKMYAML